MGVGKRGNPAWRFPPGADEKFLAMAFSPHWRNGPVAARAALAGPGATGWRKRLTLEWKPCAAPFLAGACAVGAGSIA